MLRQCWNRTEGVTARHIKNFRSDHCRQPTYGTQAADEVVERRGMARQQDLNEIYRAR
jgi:hypothetical protein